MLTHYRSEFADFNIKLTRELYLFNSGQKERYEVADIYDRYSDLFNREAIEELRRELQNVPEYFESERRAIKHLITFAIENFIESKINHLTEEILEHEAKSSIAWDGESVEFHRSAALLANEPDKIRRRRLYDLRAKIINETDDLRGERLAKMHELASELGFDGYTAMCRDIYNVDYERLAEQVKPLLAKTEDLYVEQLSRNLPADAHVSLEEAERADMPYFLRSVRFDRMFPESRLILVYRETMHGLGIKTYKQTNIEIDDEARPRKNPRAFCAPIVIPDEVKLVINPIGGQDDYQALLHEAGHAQHFGWTAPDLKPDYKYAGDRALSEMYAFLFQYLLSDHLWLREMLGFDRTDDFIRTLLLHKLLILRRYVAKLNYEVKLHSGAIYSEAGQLYADLLTEATRFRHGSDQYLSDIDDGFYSGDYLRAWILEVQLRDWLKTKYGRSWWRSRKAGDLLIQIWQTGNRYTADEIASQAGFGPLSLDSIIEEFGEGLKSQ